MGKSKIGLLFSTAAGAALGAGAIYRIYQKKLSSSTKRAEKFKGYYEMLGQWITLKNSQVSIEDYFLNHDIHTIAVYGMGNMGIYLCQELKDSQIEVK